MRITNENFIRGWTRSKESQFYNRSVAAFFVLGVFVGLALGYFVYTKMISDHNEEIKEQERLIELLELRLSK